jgi:hypothetical protein
MRAWVKFIIASSCSSMALTLGTVAQANETCEALKAELAQTPLVISNRSDMRLYAGAMTRQNFEIRKLLQNMQQLGCSSSVSVMNAEGHDICQDMQTSLNAMQANKQHLSSQRDIAGRTGDLNPRRQELLAALKTHACDVPDTALPADTDAPRPFEAPVYPEYSGQSTVPTGILRGEISQPSAEGGYRTLCVRTCDGAFFPISPNTPPADFGRDAAQCQRMCPDTKTELYYSRLSQEAEDMVSTITGRPYREMPTAFAYRNRAPGRSGECSCRERSAQSPSVLNAETSSVINIKTPPKSQPESVQTQPVVDTKNANEADKVRVFDVANTKVR